MNWPIRTHICTSCRTLHDAHEGDRCSCGYGIVAGNDPRGYAWLSQYALGAPAPPRLLAAPLRGRLRASAVLPSPIGRYPVPGYSLEFLADIGVGVVMRDAACLPFDLVSDDDEVLVTVPGGRVRLLGAPSSRWEMPGMVQSFIRSRSRWDLAAPDPFRSTTVIESALFHGARVEVHAAVTQRPDPRMALGYREAASMNVTAGVPVIVFLGD